LNRDRDSGNIAGSYLVACPVVIAKNLTVMLYPSFGRDENGEL
jgi:hypothetical protein